MAIIRMFWSRSSNFGDEIGPYIVNRIVDDKVKYCSVGNYSLFGYIRLAVSSILHLIKGEAAMMYRFKVPGKSKVLLSVGSILNCSNNKCIVWGSGIIKKDDTVAGGTFYAVRGKLSRNRLIELGYKVPEVFGDPAMLLPLFFTASPNGKNSYIGIIPHKTDYLALIRKFKEDSRFVVINLSDPIERIIECITQCKYIVSSSLHGIIVSHSYGVPAIWFKLNPVGGDDVKFADYFSSVGICDYTPFSFDNCDYLVLNDLFMNRSDLSKCSPEKINEIQRQLLHSFPFTLNKKALQILARLDSAKFTVKVDTEEMLNCNKI